LLGALTGDPGGLAQLGPRGAVFAEQAVDSVSGDLVEQDAQAQQIGERVEIATVDDATGQAAQDAGRHSRVLGVVRPWRQQFVDGTSTQ
jgi:hypothetical protein